MTNPTDDSMKQKCFEIEILITIYYNEASHKDPAILK